ncbi:MAG: protein translocase subunit SecD, partial [Clostridiales bacterium]|nr:protein translocase subunit SecD [Clostridiales bacterium]
NFISVPSVSNAITGGQAQITGMDSFEEAEKLASTIRIGGLKLELEELRSNVVGAQLGAEAISTSLKAGAIGIAVVALFMIAIYWVPGLASSIALCIYVSLTLVLLNAFNITLTLPGIAGIILSIGMAVDANVIIFARIREEIGTGKTVQSSIKIGFEKALSAIIDGNVTTLIAAVVLGIKGTGSVKGFAQTLGLGIIVSMFTALFITRFILNSFYALGIKDVKFYGMIKEKKSFDFIGKRKFFFAGAIIAIVAGFAAMGINSANGNGAMNYSLDFIGGTSTNVTLNEDLTIEEINEQVVPVFETITKDANIQPQKISGGNSIIVKTRALNVEEREALNTALVDNFGVDETLITSETIGSTISSEMQMDAIIAVLISLVLMLIYIWFRFKDPRFATSSIMSLVQDVLVVLTCYAVLRIPVGSNFIACELTIIGYSINATIVIFDRVRENMVGMKKNADLKELLNKSITQTLSRSIFTSLTTFITIGALYVLGVSSIREFALPLMVGIVAGTYSSVCLSGAFWYVAKTKFVKKEKNNSKK